MFGIDFGSGAGSVFKLDGGGADPGNIIVGLGPLAGKLAAGEVQGTLLRESKSYGIEEKRRPAGAYHHQKIFGQAKILEHVLPAKIESNF